MTQKISNDSGTPPPSGAFVNTRWTLIAQARQGGSVEAAQALETLCKSYWYPLYVFVRRKRFGAEDAEDLTQGFFAHLLERNFPDHVDREKGKFRSFLLASLNYFLSNHRTSERAQKRGGGQKLLSLDEEPPEDRYKKEPISKDSPEKSFERHWALAVMDQARIRLEEDYRSQGKGELFDRLSLYLDDEADAARYREEAMALSMTPGAVSVAVHRLRHRFREMIHAEVSQTVADTDDVETEFRYLHEVLARG